MKKVKYYYSTKTQRFEPVQLPFWKKALRVFGFISAILVTAAIIVALAFRYLQSPNEKRMNLQLAYLQEKYDGLRNDMKQFDAKIAELEERDNKVYREIFEAEPLPDSIRTGRIAIDEQKLAKRLSPLSNEELVETIELNLKAMLSKMAFQAESYDTLEKYLTNKQAMLASIPSIQPVSNKDLNRIASGFGFRIDPIYKIGKFHAGLDFTAPTGTPIYATGDGVVESAEYNASGYGNNIWIKHGFGYRTHYCHMVKLKAHQSQSVKRGEVIGWVGSTGKSTGPHCHYEVERRGEKVDPIHFFYNDLKAEDFERMVKIAQTGNQAFD
ncbi:MAG TPA: M23 family metallopeptidase [Chitinophagaceae bacterium]|nr:M23 family metallopeptidase [Chitinophagaceae bacterium]